MKIFACIKKTGFCFLSSSFFSTQVCYHIVYVEDVDAITWIIILFTIFFLLLRIKAHLLAYVGFKFQFALRTRAQKKTLILGLLEGQLL